MNRIRTPSVSVVLSVVFFLSPVPGLLQVLLKFRFCVPSPVTHSPQLCRCGMLVVPFPRVVIHAGPWHLFIPGPAAFFCHIWIVSQAGAPVQPAAPEAGRVPLRPPEPPPGKTLDRLRKQSDNNRTARPVPAGARESGKPRRFPRPRCYLGAGRFHGAVG